MKKFLIITLLLVLIGWNEVIASQGEIALILKSRGVVSVAYGDGSRSQLVSKGYLVLSGATLQTGSNGYASLKYLTSGSIAVIRPRSEVIINASYNAKEKINNESFEIKTGEVYLNIEQPKKHTFDLFTPTNLASLYETQCLVILSKSDNHAAFYNLDGSMKIADNNFTTWWDLAPESAAFSIGDGIINVSNLSMASLPRLRAVCDSTTRLKSGPVLVHTLKIKSGNDGVTEPSGKLVVLNGVGINIKAVPEMNSYFTRWNLLDGNARIKDVTSSETQVFVSSDAIIEAQFAETPSKLTISKSERGATDPSGEISIRKGLPVTIRVLPKKGFTFTNWTYSGNIKVKKVSPYEVVATLFSQTGTIKPKFTRKTYQIIVKGDKNGSVKPNNVLKVTHGDSVLISATPKKNYRFIEWKMKEGHASVRDIRSSNTIVVCDSMDVSLEATFAKNTVQVSILDHKRADLSPLGEFFVPRNSFLSVNVFPDTGFMVSGWKVERGKAHVQGLENAIIKCKTPFEIIPDISVRMYNLTLLKDDLGTVSPLNTEQVTHNKPATISATPQKGNYFIHWKLSGGWADIKDPQSDTTQVTLSHGDAVIQARFAPTICTLNVLTTLGGYTEPSGPVKNYVGGEIIIQAVPNPKAAFIGWKVADNTDSSGVLPKSKIVRVTDSMIGNENITFSDTLSVPEQTITSLKGNASIKALFSTETIKMTLLTNGQGRTEPGEETYVVKDKVLHIKAIPNEGQSFIEWVAVSGEVTQFDDPFSAETNINPGLEDVVIKALFQPDSLTRDESSYQSGQYTLTVIISDKSEGSINKDEKVQINAGESVTITAIPNTGFYFNKWKVIDGTVLFSNKYSKTTTITLKKGNAIITPDFEEKPKYNLEIIFLDTENRTKTIKSKFQ